MFDYAQLILHQPWCRVSNTRPSVLWLSCLTSSFTSLTLFSAVAAMLYTSSFGVLAGFPTSKLALVLLTFAVHTHTLGKFEN